jgi:hypothetical protein
MAMGSTVAVRRKAKGRNRMVLGVRGSEAWKAWLDQYAESRRMTLVDLIDKALEEDARRNGFRPPPMR